MSSFNDRFKRKYELENELFTESFRKLSGAVTGGEAIEGFETDRFLVSAVMEEIAGCFGINIPDSSDGQLSVEQYLEDHFRPHGIMWRKVQLRGSWYKEAAGIMLAYMKDGRITALIPSENTGFTFTDPDSGKKLKLTAKNTGLFDGDAILFYRSLPLRRLSMADIRSFVFSCITRRDLFNLVFATVLIMLLGMVMPAMSRLLLDKAAVNKDMDLLAGIFILLVDVTVISFIMTVMKQLVLVRVASRTAIPLQAAFMMRILTAPADQVKGVSSGDLGNRIGSMYQNLRILLITSFSLILTAACSLVCFVQMFMYDAALASAGAAVVILLLILFSRTAKLQMDTSAALIDSRAEESGITYDLIDGMQKISLSGAERRAFSVWANVYRRYIEKLYDPPLLLKVFSSLTPVIMMAGTIALYFTAVRTGTSTLDYFSFLASYGIVTGALSAMSQNLTDFARALPVFRSLKQIMDIVPEIGGSGDAVTELKGNIKMQNVTFAYDPDMPPVISDMSFEIKSGEYVAITGSTGCGKSTLLRLLLGFETADKGEVFYDDKPLRSLDVTSLRKRIGTVLQDGEIFQGTILSNITVTGSEMSEEDAWKAAETAGIAEEIRSMPLQMNTPLPAGGAGVSGGQKQRLLIARAIASEPKILFFDEATSALDNITQKEVSDAIGKLSCTRVVIAHRLSTICDCDRILCMDKGKIAEEGTYEELMKKNGLFAELVRRQQI